jgi:hypothetical protein
MRRLCVTLILSTILPLAAPQRADAFWRWLDELSGPGKFYGAELDIRIACKTVKPKAKYESDLLTALQDLEKEVKTRGSANALETKMLSMGVGTPCLISDKKLDEVRKASFNVVVGYQLAKKTNLVYAGDEQRPVGELAPERNIYNASVRPTGWLRLARSVEVGFGVGVYWFWGTDSEQFVNVSLEPQIDVKPLALVRDILRKPVKGIPDSQFDQMISIRGAYTPFPGGFEAQDFHAEKFRNGDLKVGAEKMWSISVILDLEPAFRLRQASRARDTLVQISAARAKGQ